MFYGILMLVLSLAISIGLGSIPAYFILKHNQKKHKGILIQNELEDWFAKGYISQDVYQKLVPLYIVPKKKSKITLLQIVYFVGSILIGIGAILFIASNWQHMAGWFKLGMVAVLSFISLFLGDYFRRKKDRKLPILGEGLILLASILWGVVIIFLFQHYQWSVSYNWLLLSIWIISILPVALCMKSEPVFYLMILLCFIWGFYCSDFIKEPFWGYLAVSVGLFFLSRGNRVKEGIIASSQFIMGFTFLDDFIYSITFWLLVSLFHQILCIWRKRKEDLIYSLIPLILAGLFTLIYFLNNSQFQGIWAEWQVALCIFTLLLAAYLVYRDQSQSALIMWLTAGYLFLWSIFVNKWNGQTNTYSYIHFYEINFGWIAGLILLILSLAVVFQKRSRLYSAWIPTCHIMLWIPLFFLSSKGIQNDNITGQYNWLYAALLILLPFLILLYQLFQQKLQKRTWPYLGFTWFCVAVILVSLIWLRDYRLFIVNFALLFTIIQSFFWSYEDDQPALFYIGMAALLFFILLRYFDLFWSMMNRSVFFIIGGFLLVGIAIVLERQKRKLDKLEDNHENS